MDSVLKGGGWVGEAKLPAAGQERQCSWAGINEEEVIFKGAAELREWAVIGEWLMSTH